MKNSSSNARPKKYKPLYHQSVIVKWHLPGQHCQKKVLKIFLVVIAGLVIIALGFQFWFVGNARGIIKQFIHNKSRGKLKLELSKLSFDYFSNKIQIHEADLVSTDTINQAITYRLRFSNLTLKVASVWPLLFQKKLVLDSIKLHDPRIEVIQWRKDTAHAFAKEDLSIPQEMGKFYNSMQDALNEYGI